MEKPSLIKSEPVKPVESVADYTSITHGVQPESGFNVILDDLHKEVEGKSATETEKPGKKAADAAASQADPKANGVKLGFASAKGLKSPSLLQHRAEKAAPGHRAESLKRQTVGGTIQKGHLEPASDWEKAQLTKNKSVLSVVGGRNRIEGEALDSAAPPDGRTAPVTSKQQLKTGLDLNGRSESQRADGSPIFRTEEGVARVVDAKNPENSAATYLKEDASEKQILEAAQKSVEKKLNDQEAPRTVREAFVRQNEQTRTEATARVTVGVKDNEAKLVQDLLDKSAPSKERNSRDGNIKAVAESKGKTASDTRAQSRQATAAEEVKTEQSQENKEAERPVAAVQTERNEAFDSRSEEAASFQVKGASRPESAGASVAREAHAAMASVTVEAGDVARALENGQRPQAIQRMTEVLNARMNYIVENARPELRLQLTPRNLGDIQIRLVEMKAGTEVRVRAERESVGRVLESIVPQIVQQLTRAGVQVQSVDIDYTGMDFNQAPNDGDPSQGGTDNPFASDHPQQEEARPDAAMKSKPFKGEDGIDVVA